MILSRVWLAAALLGGCLTDDSVAGPGQAPAGGESAAADGDGADGGGEGEGETGGAAGGARDWTPAELALAQARGEFPDFAAFNAGVIQRTCSPNPGVCHQGNNYPDLHTDANVLAGVGAPCNVEMPDPSQGWDRCERLGDRIEAGPYSGVIGAIEELGAGRWSVTVKPAPAAGMTGPHRPKISRADGDVLLDPPQEFFMGLRLEPGETRLELSVLATADVQAIVSDILATVIVGDFNGNGVHGAEAPEGRANTIEPGDPSSSYLWGRVTGTAPGFRMPLANQPLSFAEYIALACWIEGLDPDLEGAPPGVTDPIDYDGCDFAASPVDYSQE